MVNIWMSGECPFPTSQGPGGEEDSSWCLGALSAHPCEKCSFLSGVGATVMGDVRNIKAGRNGLQHLPVS